MKEKKSNNVDTSNKRLKHSVSDMQDQDEREHQSFLERLEVVFCDKSYVDEELIEKVKNK